VERILLFVEPGPRPARAARWALALAHRLEARVIAASVIDPAELAGDPGLEAKLSDLEEQSWKILYEIEDDAFKADVKISLLLDQGDPLDRLVELGRSYGADLLVLGEGSAVAPAEILKRSPAPVCFIVKRDRQTKER